MNLGKKVGKRERESGEKILRGVVYCWRKNSFCFEWREGRGRISACDRTQLYKPYLTQALSIIRN